MNLWKDIYQYALAALIILAFIAILVLVIVKGAQDNAGGATAWTNESDRRLKKNITPITDGLKIVKGLEGVRFEWKDGREPGVRVGFIAQNVEKVLPEVVYPGEPYAMQSSQITAVLVEAVKEQQKQIESQQKQIDRLIEEINGLKNQGYIPDNIIRAYHGYGLYTDYLK